MKGEVLGTVQGEDEAAEGVAGESGGSCRDRASPWPRELDMLGLSEGKINL